METTTHPAAPRHRRLRLRPCADNGALAGFFSLEDAEAIVEDARNGQSLVLSELSVRGSPERIAAILEKRRQAFEEPFSFEQRDSRDFTLHVETATVLASMTLDSRGRIKGIFFHRPVSTRRLDEHVETLRSLHGTPSLLIENDEESLADMLSHEALAVASASKLVIVKAVKNDFDSGVLSWTYVVPRNEEGR